MEPINRRFVRTLTVEKMRSTALAPGQYVFDILANRGIVLRDQSEGASLEFRRPPVERLK
jgi:KaiC/GvpD/RAD55 family RecA-like ATPase